MSEEQLHHRVDGHGAGVVLLHPIGLDSTWWDPYVDALARAWRVVRPDFPGHGRSPLRSGGFTLEQLAGDVARLIEQLSAAPAHVVGLSLGGMVAQHLALGRPELVGSLTLIGTLSTLSDEGRAAMRRRGEDARRSGMQAVVEPTIRRWFSRERLDSPAVARCRRHLAAADPSAWSAGWDAIAETDTHARLNAIRAPTQVLVGSRDVSTPPEVSAEIAQRVPGSRLLVIEDAPHMGPFERPEPFLAAIEEFLAGASRRPRADT